MMGKPHSPKPQLIVCFARCWACNFDNHYDPREWHTWADEDDVAHAEAIGAADPRESRCSCWCADETGAEPLP
jgi:hypothetical protein